MVLSNAGILVAVRSFFSRVTASLVALGIFVVGAFSFGGVYPVSVAPAIFRLLHPVYWLSYQREAYIAATEGLGGGKFLGGAAGLVAAILLCVAVVALREVMRRRAAKNA